MKKRILAVVVSLCLLSLCACGTGKSSSNADKDVQGSNAESSKNGNNSNTGGQSSSSASTSDFPHGLIRISDIGDGKLVFIIDTGLIDDDLSGVVQCDLYFDDYSVNYTVWDENSLNCDIVYHYDEDGKHKGRTVVRGDHEFKDGKLIITFPAEEIYALGDFKYGDFEKGYFYVFRDNSRKVYLPYTAADLLVNDDTAIAESNLTNDYGIGYKSSSFDLQYFTPATDDYIITAWDNADSEGNPTQTNALFSFNDTGKCVQYVARIDIPVDTDLGSMDVSVLTGENGYYRDYSNGLSIYNGDVSGEKAMILYYLSTGDYVQTVGTTIFDEGYQEGARIYCSKPLKSVSFSSTKSRSDVSLDTVSSYFGEVHVGNDYIASSANESCEAFIEKRTLIADGKPVFDSKTNEYIEQEYSWPAVTWDTWTVCEYDTNGYQVKSYTFFVFEDSELIPVMFYRLGGLNYNWEHPENGVLRYPGYRSDSPIAIQFEGDYMDFLDDRWVRLSDNILCRINEIEPSDYAEGRRTQHKFPGSDYFYYSIPSVSEDQLKTLDMTWQYRTFRE